MSKPYHKILKLYRSIPEGKKNAGKADVGNYSMPEFGYLAKNVWQFTEKVDGTNMRVGWTSTGVSPSVEGRTNNAVVPKALSEYMSETFTHERFRQAFPYDQTQALFDVTLYGEGYGPSIHGGGKYRDDTSFVLFDVKVGDWWLTRDSVNDVGAKLGVDTVPVIWEGPLLDGVDLVRSGFVFNDRGGIEKFGHRHLRSTWGDFEAEGVVARPKVDMFDRGGRRIIAKIRGRDFK